jgi:hypothetical protein
MQVTRVYISSFWDLPYKEIGREVSVYLLY